ncbi:hypothetical protein [Haloechinothrix sp. LS1_15]|uniref:hypothetical protein n=1 Tax=Haloechinothrix sp. LS1_15 TaxID=2652248 RepID=UPI002944EB90|nr:hypothetical protein [Haloechinothrix sp. LS1_15]MDV6011203.1 hypothetical protein [Haloechinothrix sp. LS1_15]
MNEVNLTISCAGMINGEIVTVSGGGLGSFDRGTLAMNFNFSTIPDGFTVYCAALWTGCCSTPTFAIEQDGGVNMLTLSGGRYRCARRFTFGPYGAYDYNYEIRLDETTGTMTATGVVDGTVGLPEIVGVDDGFTEMMVPVGRHEVRSYSSTTFTSASGEIIPVGVEGRYTPLDDDRNADWTCCATNQVRKSFINVLDAEETNLSLEYHTVVSGITAPDPVLHED